jgi:leucyl-tRNA synthetase
MLAPIAPHFCEELWHVLGNKESIFKASWPGYDSGLIVDQVVTVVIQVNGKVRSKIECPADTTEEQLKSLALADEKVQSWIQGKPIRNCVIVPRKLINLVI